MLRRWEVWNFMCIAHGVVEFDESNIVNIKGYNDSGKSALFRALDVLFFNKWAHEQAQFIKDGEEYFRVTAQFDDGVTLLRDKYLNGQSLYEMYKGNECVYSTKVNGVLSKVTEVPEPIALYLNMIDYLNSRSCFQKQFLVQTTGRENDQACSEILHSEEVTSAGNMVNADKNKLIGDINALSAKADVYQQMLVDGKWLTKEYIDALERMDAELGGHEGMLADLQGVSGFAREASQIKILPEYREVQGLERLAAIQGVCELKKSADNIIPSQERHEIQGVERLEALQGLQSLAGEANSIQVSKEYPEVQGLERLAALQGVCELKRSVDRINPSPEYTEIQGIERLELLESLLALKKEVPDVSAISEEIQLLEGQAKELASSYGYRVCPNCGSLVG